jgi:hypothetical protein
VARLLKEENKLLAGDLTFLRVGTGEVVVAEVILIQLRQEQNLIGACRVGADRYRSVVFAVLDALNRIMQRLVPGQWVEYRVDPEGAPAEARSRA